MTHALIWTPAVSKADGPLYLAIAEALASDIRSGRLQAGQRLPPQRALAQALGIDFTTVSRAYAEAGRRGLVEGRVGQGTYIRRQPEASRGGSGHAPASGIVDMSMNLPPHPQDSALAARMWDGAAALREAAGPEILFQYQIPGGAERDRAAGAQWLTPRLGAVPVGRVLVCPGAQGALLAVLGALAAPGDVVCTQTLTYPGFLSAAAHLRLQVAGIAADGEGLLPEAFETVCKTLRPKALYCNPTLHNPTTATLSAARRRALLDVARRYAVPVIEDDAYGALPANPVAPLAALDPGIVYHIAGVAKALSPALRIAYLVSPNVEAARRLSLSIRATASMASPLTAALATLWIEDGTAQAALEGIRHETHARQQLARHILPHDCLSADVEGFHIWLRLPPPWTRGDFASRLRSAGIGVVTADAFAVGSAPEAVRLGLGVPASQDTLIRSLETVRALLQSVPATSSIVV